MLRFLSTHVVEDLRGVGVDLPQTIGEVAVNATVLLFERNGQGQNLALGQFAEFSRHRSIPRFVRDSRHQILQALSFGLQACRILRS
jgi:hypothetical protein